LNESQEGSVEDAGGCEGDKPGRGLTCLHGEQADVEADEGVDPELAGNDHAHGYGGFRECVGEPAVEAEDRDLDGEGDEESEGSPAKSFCGELAVVDGGLEGLEVEGTGFGVEPENCDKQWG
jgi:hypothetical protein